MKKLWLYVILPVLLLVGVLVFGYYKKQFDIKSSYEGAAYIKSFRTSSGSINDVSNKIGMKDPNIDFKWFMDEKKNIRIEFGYITMTFPLEEFMTDYCKSVMEGIGITYKLAKEDDGTAKLVLFYNGKEMERWLE